MSGEKKIIVVAGIEDRLRREYLKQLKDLSGELAEVREYAVGREQELIRGDEAIALTHAASAIVRQFAGEIPVTLLRTTFSLKALDRLKQIPAGTSVLLVSYEWTYLAECIELLKRLGIQHINFIPYFKGMEEGGAFEDVKTAVYMGCLYVEPPGVKELIDIGWRRVTPECWKEILDCVGIDLRFAKNGLQRLRRELPEEHANIGMIMSDSSATSRLQRILDVVPTGILVVDGRGRVEVYNSFVCRMFGLSKTQMLGRDIGTHPGLNRLYERISGTMLEENLYYTERGLSKEYIIHRRNVSFMEEKYQDIIMIEEAIEPVKQEKPHAEAAGRKAPMASYTFDQIICGSEAMKRTMEFASRYARTDLSVLILGETGTGKELFAHAIHNASARRHRPFISLNCAAIPAELLESELFGYEKGSFTGARSDGKKGLFELANGGTIFLDEIGDAGELFQVKLLRVLQEKEVTKVGGYERIPLDVRILAATNKPIDDLEGCLGFRKDLFYRLSSCILSIPPLRERRGDILLLTRYYLDSMGAAEKKPGTDLEAFLVDFPWEGNVRELKNCVEYLGYFGRTELTIEDLPMLYQAARQKAGRERAVLQEKSELSTAEISSQEPREEKLEELILRIIGEHSGGRRQIAALLCRKGISCTEYQVRVAMDRLEKEGFLQKAVGRSGSSLTRLGEERAERTERASAD